MHGLKLFGEILLAFIGAGLLLVFLFVVSFFVAWSRQGER